MRFHGIDFNEEWVISMSEEEFVAHPFNDDHWKLPTNRATDEVRRARLKEIHQLLSPKPVKKKSDGDNKRNAEKD